MNARVDNCSFHWARLFLNSYVTALFQNILVGHNSVSLGHSSMSQVKYSYLVLAVIL
jgi:hypothetical protein